MKSVLPYQGGKSRLATTIVARIPDHKCYVEPFCGACWVFLNKEPSVSEVLNDRDSELVTFWRVIQNHLEEFLRYYKWSVTSREIFALEKRKDPATLTDIQRATRYFYLQRHAFGGKVDGRTFGTSTTGGGPLHLTDLEERLLEVHWRMKRVQIENLDAVACITRYDRKHSFFFIDPPYYETAGYADPFCHGDYLRLRSALDQLKGKFLLSLNDHPMVREIFDGFNFKRVTLKYSIGKAAASRGKERAELLIQNY
jgi:DNA adenine methylase